MLDLPNSYECLLDDMQIIINSGMLKTQHGRRNKKEWVFEVLRRSWQGEEPSLEIFHEAYLEIHKNHEYYKAELGSKYSALRTLFLSVFPPYLDDKSVDNEDYVYVDDLGITRIVECTNTMFMYVDDRDYWLTERYGGCHGDFDRSQIQYKIPEISVQKLFSYPCSKYLGILWYTYNIFDATGPKAFRAKIEKIYHDFSRSDPWFSSRLRKLLEFVDPAGSRREIFYQMRKLKNGRPINAP